MRTMLIPSIQAFIKIRIVCLFYICIAIKKFRFGS